MLGGINPPGIFMEVRCLANKKTQSPKRSKLSYRIAKKIKKVSTKREKEYSKRLLNRIVNSSILMLWATYILAWFDKTEIAETLSKTIVTSVIAVVVGYLAKSVIENISKNTTAFGDNINQKTDSVIDTEDYNDISTEGEDI